MEEFHLSRDSMIAGHGVHGVRGGGNPYIFHQFLLIFYFILFYLFYLMIRKFEEGQEG